MGASGSCGAELLGLYLDPAGLDSPGHDQKDGGLQLLLELDVKLLGVVVKGLQQVVRDEQNEGRLITFVLRHGQLNHFGELESLKLRDRALDFSKCSAHLGFDWSQILHESGCLLCFVCRIVQLPSSANMVIYQ